MPTWTKEQKDAIELAGSNIIVSAGAGSGKTAVLSERVIFKLKSGIHIDELLILTFTRAAAEEMKDRIRKKIKKEPSLQNELDSLDSAYITTFDSFALAVLKKYHYLLNISHDIEITDETIVKIQKKKIIDEIFSKLYINIDEGFANLVKKYSLKNDKTLKSAIFSLAEKIETFTDKIGYLNFLKNEFFTEKNIDLLIEQFKKLVESKKQTLKLELENTYHYFDSNYTEKLDQIILPIINTGSLTDLIKYKGTKLPPVPRNTDEEAKRVKESLKNALTELLSLCEFGDEKKIYDDIMSTKETVHSIVKIIESYFKELENYKKNNKIFTFNDVALLSTKVIKENEEARLELKNKFKEIMIDEYQDTNDIQENFISMIANDNVYMVGDIKQSIYRFRGSNPSIFKDKYDMYAKNSGGCKIDLIKNFRSRSEVLNNINKIFSLIMTDELGGAAYTISHEMIYGNTTYDEARFDGFDYNFEVLEYDQENMPEFFQPEIEIFTIAQDIKNKMDNHLEVFDKDSSTMRPFKYSDAVIILDRSKHFDLFKKIFEFLNIPLTILKDDKLNSSTDIILIKNIIDLIIRIHNNDFGTEFKLDFLSIGRSFLYEYTDENIFEIFTDKNFKNTNIYSDFQNFENYNSLTIREFIERILSITGFFDKISKVGNYENTFVRISKLIDIATNLGKIGYTIENFRDYLEEVTENDFEIKYTPPTEEADSVKILTIHKSKGLEYPICYFADLDHNFNTSELKEKFIASTKYGIIAPITTLAEEDFDSCLKTLYKHNFIKEEISEKIRLFYVALTRAREKMIILLPKKDTTKLEKEETGAIAINRRLKFNTLASFIYGIKDYLPEYFHTVDLAKLNLTKKYLYIKESELKDINRAHEDFVVSELNIEPIIIEEKTFSKNLAELISKETKDNMLLGTKIHEVLEYIDFKNPKFENIEDNFIKDIITSFFQNEILKNVKQAKIYKEYEFIYDVDSTEYHGVIDAMLEYDDHIDIIDYKLKNTQDAHYIEQLTGYKKYIESVSNKNVNIYLYSLLDKTFTKLG